MQVSTETKNKEATIITNAIVFSLQEYFKILDIIDNVMDVRDSSIKMNFSVKIKRKRNRQCVKHV